MSAPHARTLGPLTWSFLRSCRILERQISRQRGRIHRASDQALRVYLTPYCTDRNEGPTRTGRPRTRLDDIALHLGAIGLPDQNAARITRSNHECHRQLGGHPVNRQPLYEWKLREVMAQHQMFQTTDLAPHITERGINLSASQVHRLVTATPEGPP